jgi:hypothetical protein
MLFLLTASLAEAAFRVVLQTALCDRVHSNTVTEYFWHESRQQPDLNDISTGSRTHGASAYPTVVNALGGLVRCRCKITK